MTTAERPRSFSLAQREAILDDAIHYHAQEGWRLAFRTATMAQMVRDKPTNYLLLGVLLVLFVAPGLLYKTLFKGELGLYLEVNEVGDVASFCS
jgi:hypothetical protein